MMTKMMLITKLTVGIIMVKKSIKVIKMIVKTMMMLMSKTMMLRDQLTMLEVKVIWRAHHLRVKKLKMRMIKARFVCWYSVNLSVTCTRYLD